MLIVDKIGPLQSHLSDWRNESNKIALVPTMGNLHSGHLSLVEKAKQIADRVVVTIFVNPAQFVEGEDYATYPRSMNEDTEQLRAMDADLLYCPPVQEIYPGEMQQHTRIVIPRLENIYCGETRPGHFAGVAIVITKIFNLVLPDYAIFGEKDYQQLLVIKKLVNDFFMPVEIIAMPTIREHDGLAMSSRNNYLTADERKIAALIYKTLTRTAEIVRSGNTDFNSLEKEAINILDGSGFRTEYFVIRDAETLDQPGTGDLVILAAARLGKARLIDNVILRR